MQEQEQQDRREQCQERWDVQSAYFWVQNTCFSFSLGLGGSLLLAAPHSAAGVKLLRPCTEICPSPRCALAAPPAPSCSALGLSRARAEDPLSFSSLYPGF